MGFFDKFPYTNFQQLNLDWIIKKIKTVETSMQAAIASAAAAKQSENNAAASEQNAADSQSAAAGSATAAAESAAGIESAREQIYLNTQRLNNLIVDGQQTAGNTELLDIRVGYDGTIYDTAGNAVRGQVSDLNQAIMQKIADGDDFTFDGYINANGLYLTNSNYSATDYISVNSQRIYYQNLLMFSATYIAFYDEAHQFMGAIQPSNSSTLQTVSGSAFLNQPFKYVRLCTHKDALPTLSVYLYLNDNYAQIETDNLLNAAVTEEKVSFITHNPETNYINGQWTENAYINQNGIVVPVQETLNASAFIKLESGENYYYGNMLNGYYAFYDSDFTLIEGHGNDNSLQNPFTTPAGTAYARFTSRTPETAWVFTRNTQPISYKYTLDENFLIADLNNNFCDYDGDEITVFNKILCIGDSLTIGTFNHTDSGQTEYAVNTDYSFPEYLQKLTGIDVTNLGQGGASSAEWYQSHANDDLSGYDCAIIQLGVNDTIRYSTWGQTSEDAFTAIINKLKSENRNIKIFIANIIPAISYSAPAYLAFSTAMSAWIAQAYGNDADVVLLDMQEHGHTKDSIAYNAGHLTALGYYRLAKDYKSYISYEISENMSAYRFVQFIGTTYTYTD